jgi:hypothetical protein
MWASNLVRDCVLKIPNWYCMEVVGEYVYITIYVPQAQCLTFARFLYIFVSLRKCLLVDAEDVRSRQVQPISLTEPTVADNGLFETNQCGRVVGCSLSSLPGCCIINLVQLKLGLS